MQAGKASHATSHAILASMDLVANLLVSVIKITQCLATILTAFACVNRVGLGTSARCSARKERLVLVVYKTVHA